MKNYCLKIKVKVVLNITLLWKLIPKSFMWNESPLNRVPYEKLAQKIVLFRGNLVFGREYAFLESLTCHSVSVSSSQSPLIDIRSLPVIRLTSNKCIIFMKLAGCSIQIVRSLLTHWNHFKVADKYEFINFFWKY